MQCNRRFRDLIGTIPRPSWAVWLPACSARCNSNASTAEVRTMSQRTSLATHQTLLSQSCDTVRGCGSTIICCSPAARRDPACVECPRPCSGLARFVQARRSPDARIATSRRRCCAAIALDYPPDLPYSWCSERGVTYSNTVVAAVPSTMWERRSGTVGHRQTPHIDPTEAENYHQWLRRDGYTVSYWAWRSH